MPKRWVESFTSALVAGLCLFIKAVVAPIKKELEGTEYLSLRDLYYEKSQWVTGCDTYVLGWLGLWPWPGSAGVQQRETSLFYCPH